MRSPCQGRTQAKMKLSRLARRARLICATTPIRWAVRFGCDQSPGECFWFAGASQVFRFANAAAPYRGGDSRHGGAYFPDETEKSLGVNLHVKLGEVPD